MNTLSECTYFYISKSITLYTFLLVFKIVKSLQRIIKDTVNYLGNIINSQKKYGNEILFILEKLKAELVTKDIYEGRIKL